MQRLKCSIVPSCRKEKLMKETESAKYCRGEVVRNVGFDLKHFKFGP